MALRGLGSEGLPIRFSREYVREGIAKSLRISAHASSGIVRNGTPPQCSAGGSSTATLHLTELSTFLTAVLDPSQANSNTRLLKQHMIERLLVLQAMGLAGQAGPNLWRVRDDFENVLRAMQRSGDRQKTLAAHGALMSDERLPLEGLDLRSLTTLEGRILVDGEEESSGRSYLMLEGTDARVHHVYYTPELEAARNLGGLRTNSFIRLESCFRWPTGAGDRRHGRFRGDPAEQTPPS